MQPSSPQDRNLYMGATATNLASHEFLQKVNRPKLQIIKKINASSYLPNFKD